MRIIIKTGDVLTEKADVLISTANPWLNLSGGVNGAIREAVGPELQDELYGLLKQRGGSAVPAGTVLRSQSYSLPFKHILHAVAIDPFYDTSAELVQLTFAKALDMAAQLNALTISSPTLATGYGRMSVAQFGNAVAPVLAGPHCESLTLTFVVRRAENASELSMALGEAGALVVP